MAEFNNLVLNSEGIYKGGARDITAGFDEGDVLCIRFVKKPVGGGAEVALGEVNSDALIAPESGKKWLWSSRDWIENGVPQV